MKIHHFATLIGMLWTSLGQAQPIPPVDCQSEVFYGLQGTEVHALQIQAGVVVDMGVVIPSLSSSLHSLAIGHDILAGSTDHIFYSSSGTGFGPYHILRFSSGAWEVVHTDSIIYHNAGGHGRFIYFQHNAANGAPNDQRLVRLLPDGSVTTIFNDTTLRFTVADITVDSTGNIYCFRGPAIGNTTELTVLDSTGQVVASIPTTLNSLSTFYGSFFLNGTLYLGWGTTNGEFFPLQVTEDAASLGVGHQYGGNGTFKDLASCQGPQIMTTVQQPASEVDPITVMQDHLANEIVIHGTSDGPRKISLFDINGRLVFSRSYSSAIATIATSTLADGVYQVAVDKANKREVRRIMIVR